MATDVKQQLLAITLKHIQGRVFEADAFYKDLEPLGQPSTYAEVLVDVFWLLWVRFEVGRGPESMNLVAAIKACWQDKRVSERQLLQVLEPECLHTVGLVRDKGAWDKKAVRYNTKLNYTILKYNLLREDSEGYAKLVTLYNHFGAGAVQQQDLPSLARELHSLIGSFDLDPNRCLDLLLDAAAAQQQAQNEQGQQQGQGQQAGQGQGGGVGLLAAVPLLKAEAVGQLLGFKLQQYQDPSRPPAPRSLFLVAAHLLAAGRTSLPELLAHLAPSDEQQAAAQRGAREALMRRVGEIGQINLGGGGGGGGGGAGAGLAAITAATTTGEGAGGSRATGLSAASFELDPAGAVGPLALGPEPGHNQPLALLDALLQVGAWDVALELYERLVGQGVVPAAHPPICAALCRLLAQQVAPAYQALFPQGVLGRNALWGDVPPAAVVVGGGAAAAAGAGGAAPQLSPTALRLLSMLGPYIHRDVRLFTKVVRLVRFQLAYPQTAAPAAQPTPALAGSSDAPPSSSAASQPSPQPPPSSSPPLPSLEELLSGVLLPGAACCPVHLPLAADVWECAKLLPVQARFRIYAEYRDLSQSQPLLQAAWRLATVETKKVLKRLVLPTDPQKKKEACRPHARMVAKVAHANPLPVMEAIVTQIEVYDNQIEVSLEALKYLSPFSYDVLTFVILSRLAMDRDKVKEDGVNISGWLQALARFTGAACRRFSDLDVGAVLQFLANTLRAGDAFDLLVLQHIIGAMTGVRLEAVLSDEQLDALSGGPELVAEAVVLDAGEADAALGMGRTATSKDLAKGRQRLLRALEEPDGRRAGGSSSTSPPGGSSASLTLPLLVLVAQQRSIIINHTDSKLIKFIATMYDRCQDTLLHLTEFLRLALPVEAYADMLPMPDVLRREYGIDVEAVWHIYRPVMSRLLDAAAPQPAEEGELEEGEDGGPAVSTGADPTTSAGGAAAGTASSSGALAPSSSAAAAAPGTSSSSLLLRGGNGGNGGLSGGGGGVEEPRVGDKTWAGVLSGLPACSGSPALWGVVSPELYATFWSLQLQDIYVPVKRYEKELQNVKDQLQLLENNYLNYIRPGLQSNSGYVSNNLQQQYETYKAEKAALQEKQSRLSGELEQRRRHVEEVRQRLQLQRGAFFLPRMPPPPQQQQPATGAAATTGSASQQQQDEAGAAAAANGQKAGASGAAAAAAGGTRPPVRAAPTYNPVVQEMFLPRLLFSASDALYCARLVLALHHLETKHFSLVMFVDTAVRATIPVLRSLTEVEANNLGVFWFQLLKQLVAWHRDEKLFIEECFRKAPTPATAKSPHNNFKSKMIVWHGVISSTFRASLESGDYTQIANALSVMGRLVTVWPGTIPAANSFRGWVEKLQKEDPREDIKTMARSYLIALNREAEKPGRMLSQLEYGGPGMVERQRAAAAAAGGAGARGGAGSSSPANPASKPAPRPQQQQQAAGGSQAGSAAAAGEGGQHKQLNASAKPFVPKATAEGSGAVAGSAAPNDGNGDVVTDSRGGGGAAAAAAAARKRPRTDGRGDGDKAAADGDKAAAGGDKAATAAAGGGGGGDGGGKKQRVEGGGGADKDGGKGRGGGGGGGGGDRDRDPDTYSDAGGRAGSETSGRWGDKMAEGGGGKEGKEGKSEKEHREHKRSKDKDRDRSGKDKEKDKERRREEKERERAEKADEGAKTSRGGGGGGGADKDKDAGRGANSAAAAGAAASGSGGVEGGKEGGGGGGGSGSVRDRLDRGVSSTAAAATEGSKEREREREQRASSAERPRTGGDAGGGGGGGEARRGGGGGGGGGSGGGEAAAAVGGGGGDAARDRSAGRDRQSRDRHSSRRSAAAEEGPDRDAAAAAAAGAGAADGGSKRRRVEGGKSEGGASPGQGTAGGSIRGVGGSTPDVRRAAGDTDMEYDERGGFALPPAPSNRGGGGGGGGSATASRGGGGGSGGGGGGGAGLPPPSQRPNGAGDTRRRSGR